jgi:Raf kinase inhibitor-like YbhB/YbcL family protein
MQMPRLKVHRSVPALIAVLAFTVSAQGQERPANPVGAPAPGPQLVLTSTAFEDGGILPAKYAGGTTAVSPALNWTGVPPGTQSFVLILHDLEAALNKSSTRDFMHWLAWNIPAASTGLPEGLPAGVLPDGTLQISGRSAGYFGPGAGPGRYHHYVFELYALDTQLPVPSAAPDQAEATRKAVFDAMEGHLLAKVALIARFHR